MDGQRMGDQFKQNRSLKAKQNMLGKEEREQPIGGKATAAGRPNSLLEIQQEQEKESFSNRGNGGNDGSRAGRGSGLGSGGGMKEQQYRGQRRAPFHRGRSFHDGPLEQGRLHTLLDNFGFIYCADRPIEIFFHYSEFGGNSNDLRVGDEVEFYVGQAAKTRGGRPDQGEEKLSAYAVRVLEPGTVQWEIEDLPRGKRHRGKVERVSRVYTRERDRAGSNEGTIRLMPDAADVPDGKSNTASFLRYNATHSNNDGSHSRLNGNGFARNDVVEFTIVTDKRTGLKHARNITLIQSEQARLEEEREKQLLASATIEQGIVVSLKENYGFLRSNKRKEEVYFHYSHVVLPEADCDVEYTLVEGQDMEFLVVAEQDGERRKKYSARKVKFLNKGSVVFQQILAKGVTGVISKKPSPPALLSGGRNRRTSSGVSGIVRLDSSITFRPVEDDGADTDIELNEVVLLPDESPGKWFPVNRDGARVGMWVREGDTLLFDVIRDVVDGKCRATPTKYMRPLSSSPNKLAVTNKEGTEEDAMQDDLDTVRMIAPSIAGRSHGVISSIKDNYGFIQLVERNADAYFRLNDVLPLELQTSMMRNTDDPQVNANWNLGNEPKLDVGTEVSFDLSVQPPQHNNSSGRGQNGRQQIEKEQVRAQRLAFLAPSTVKLSRIIASDCRATVVKDSPRQKGAGQLELETKVTGLTLKQRYPITSRLLEVVQSKGEGFSVTFHEAQSDKEYHIIKELVATEDDLELRSEQVSAGDVGERTLDRIIIANVGKKKEQSDTSNVSICNTASQEASISCESGDGKSNANENPLSNQSSKKLKTKVKSAKTIYFDMQSLSSKFEGPPPRKDDVVNCDVIQCCRTGAFSVSNIELIERNAKVQDPTSSKNEKTSGMGFILDVIENRQCGRISLFDEDSHKRQILSFSYTDVSFSPSLDESTTNEEFRTIRKGHEVSFDITRFDRKLVAKNVMVVPEGTINVSNKLDKSQYQGYILLEPSSTALSNTKSPTLVKGTDSGRWGNCVQEGGMKQSDEPTMSGRILLLSDRMQSSTGIKSNLTGSKSDNDDTESVQSSSKESKTDDNVNASSKTIEDKGKHVILNKTSVQYAHLSYNNASIQGRSTKSQIDNPKRGDLVSFSKGKGGKIRDICVVKPSAATTITGTLENVDISAGTASFCSNNDMKDTFQIFLTEVVSCDVSLLKDKEMVEGISYAGKIFGVCRTADLYLKSTWRGSDLKERPRLNLTVKKELKGLGGKIIAQSGMAKGPDGTIGFPLGWTKRICKFNQNAEESTLDVNSKEFYPDNVTTTKNNGQVVLESELS